MPWICPNCGKKFRNTRQWHSCLVSTIDEHLNNKPLFISDIFRKLVEIVSGFGEFELIPIKTSIQFRNGATFLGIRLKKSEVIIEFFLDFETDHPLVFKKFRVSGKRLIYYLSVQDVNQIDTKLIKLLKSFYRLVGSA